MDRWVLMFLSKLDQADIKVWALVKYVDNINVILEKLDLDQVWSGDKLVRIQGSGVRDTEAASSVVSWERHTMSLIKQAAYSIHPWLRFTMDIPKNHSLGMVLMLDLQVWVEVSQDQPDRIVWVFYEKETVSSRVLMATSAYKWRSKLVTMNMENL